jgi:hypothetical protein
LGGCGTKIANSKNTFYFSINNFKNSFFSYENQENLSFNGFFDKPYDCERSAGYCG